MIASVKTTIRVAGRLYDAFERTLFCHSAHGSAFQSPGLLLSSVGSFNCRGIQALGLASIVSSSGSRLAQQDGGHRPALTPLWGQDRVFGASRSLCRFFGARASARVSGLRRSLRRFGCGMGLGTSRFFLRVLAFRALRLIVSAINASRPPLGV